MQSTDRLTLNTIDTVHIVEIKNILYCKCDNSYTTFFIVNHDPVVISQGIKKVELQLSQSDFIKTHQSYLVNINHIKEIKKTNLLSIILSDNTVIPVSTRRKKEIMQRFLQVNNIKSINK